MSSCDRGLVFLPVFSLPPLKSMWLSKGRKGTASKLLEAPLGFSELPFGWGSACGESWLVAGRALRKDGAHKNSQRPRSLRDELCRHGMSHSIGKSALESGVPALGHWVI